MTVRRYLLWSYAMVGLLLLVGGGLGGAAYLVYVHLVEAVADIRYYRRVLNEPDPDGGERQPAPDVSRLEQPESVAHQADDPTRSHLALVGEVNR